MSDKIVSLKGEIPDGSGIANPEVVKELEDLLERAKRGEIVAIAIVGVRPNRRVFTGWWGSSLGYNFELSHGISMLSYRYMREQTPEEYDDDKESDN